MQDQGDEFSKLFIFDDADSRTLKMVQKYEIAMSKGQICPGSGSYPLTFKLNSDVLGEAT